MNLIHDSFARLFPEKDFPYQPELEYNRRLSDFNANIRLYNNILKVSLNLQWKDIDDEIKIGLIQSLLLKILKKKGHTRNIVLYNNFLRNIPALTLKTKNDPLLEASFARVNQQFFQSQLQQPNLKWGTASFRKLASYNFHNDTIAVSTLFNDAKPQILDFIMYHEMLHKFHKFKHSNGRSAFHTREFREAEHSYPGHEKIEKEITAIIRMKKLRRSWWRR
ncbi:hypothetical protein HYX14_03660 [Candidatus Woesearchaeota archaeon]|nr:hypothetical protein [Candidatus Woesearchaeota archaeon]